MEFHVHFTTGLNNDTSPFDHFNPGKGLDYVEAIRELAEWPKAPLSIIEPNTTCSRLTGETSYKIKVKDEKDIDNIDGFDVAKQAAVIVPVGYLGQFVRMTVDVRYQSQDEAKRIAEVEWTEKHPRPRRGSFMGKFKVLLWTLRIDMVIASAARAWNRTEEHKHPITRLTNDWTVDEDALYAAWKEAGFPVYWGISEQTFSRHKEERVKLVAQTVAARKAAGMKKQADKIKGKHDYLVDVAADLQTLGSRLKRLVKEDL